jgi:hypothetical protein
MGQNIRGRTNEHIEFRHAGQSRSKKTGIWDVRTVVGIRQRIGQVKWFAPWRRYVFIPETDTLYDEKCLKKLAEFCEAATKQKWS